MAETKSRISLAPQGVDFLLTRTNERGEKLEMMLSDIDVLSFAQSAQRLRDSILDAGVHMPVAQVSLNTEVDVNKILLGLIDKNGAEQRFSLPLEVAKRLAERLAARVAEIEEKIQTTTWQWLSSRRASWRDF